MNTFVLSSAEPLAISLMSSLNPVKETCQCRVCRSDLAYIVPCEYEDALEFTLIDPTKGIGNEPLQEYQEATAS